MDEYESAFNWLELKQSEMIESLQAWCDINSGTCHLAGISTMRDVLLQAFSALGAPSKIHSVPPFFQIDEQGMGYEQALGETLSFRCRPQAPLQVLLCGHMDTVYPADDSFQQCRWLKPNVLNGPGVTDMKGGLVVMLYTLLALERSAYAKNIGWEVLINADEEIGSKGSASLLAAAAQRHQLGLVFEPGYGEAGVFAGARKGSGKVMIVVHGKAAHAGRSFHKGINAIVALSHIIQQIQELNGQRSEMTINVGRVAGGTALNVVPEKAVVWLDIRIQQATDAQWVMDQIREIIKTVEASQQVQVQLHESFSRPVKTLSEKNIKLLHILQDLGKGLGIPISWVDTGGCCDGNNLAAAGLPTVDSLGVRGEHIHSHEEIIYTDSLVERAKLSTLFLLKLANREVVL